MTGSLHFENGKDIVYSGTYFIERQAITSINKQKNMLYDIGLCAKLFYFFKYHKRNLKHGSNYFSSFISLVFEIAY